MTRWMKWIGFLVTCTAVTAIVVSQAAAARQVQKMSVASSIGSSRIRSGDPKFKASAALVLYDVRQIVAGNKIDMNMQGAFVYSETFVSYKAGETTIWHTSLFSKDPNRANEQFKAMTPAELAQAETLFSSFNMAKAPGVSVNKFGFSGEVTSKQIGLRKGQLAQMTKMRLQNELAHANKAMEGLGGG
jgi:hypothetical protein